MESKILCDHGCGREATKQFKNGKFCCSSHYNMCPASKDHLKKPRSKGKPFININHTLCDYNCGQEAKFTLKNGKYCCNKSQNQCLQLKKKNSASLSKRTGLYKFEECQYCKNKFTSIRIKKHERHCYLNPNNIKICPVCDNPIKDYKHTSTCSVKCGNSFFRHAGPEHWNYNKGHSYRSICFRNHGHKCLVCDESILVQAHHLDKNRSNDNPENLVPLCLNHHWYMHSKHKGLIEGKVLGYVEEFKKKNINLPI